MRFNLSLGVVCVSVLIGGCTKDLTVRGIREDQPRIGIGYVLPFTQYAVTETWTLDYCPAPPKPIAERGKRGKANRARAAEPPKPVVPGGTEPKISLKVAAAASSADDGELAFMINPQELQTLTSVTAFAAKWQDGRNMLASINASAEDRTAQIIGNITKAAVKILPLAMGMPSAPGAAPGPPPLIECSEDAVANLGAAKDAKKSLDTFNALVEERTAEVNRLAAKVQQQGLNVDEGTKKALGDAVDLLVAARGQQADATDGMTRALKKVSYVRTLTWPTDGNSFSHGPDRLPPDVVAKWLKPESVPLVHPREVYLQIERTGSFGRHPARPNLTPDATSVAQIGDERKSPVAAEVGDASYAIPDRRLGGIRYRMPATGRLVACYRSPCGSADLDGTIAAFDGPVAQLGYVNVLPFRGRAFGNNNFSAEFAQDGSLKSVGYEQKAAPAEVASGAFADAAGQLSDVLSPTARLTAGTTYLKALKDRRDALEALKAQPESAEATEKASLDADTALLNAKIANLNATIALQELQAKQTGGN